MNNKLVVTIIGVAVMIIICASVLVPVIQDSKEQITTVGHNEDGAYTVSTKNVPITFSYSDEGYTLNGKLIEADYSLGSQMCIITDKFVAATNPINSSKVIYLAYEGHAFVTPTSIHCENGKLTYTVSGADTTVDVNYSWIAYPSNDGDYMYAGNLADVYIDKKSEIILGFLGPSVNGESSLSTTYAGKGAIDALIPLCYSGDTYALTAPAAIQSTYETGLPYELSPAIGLSVESSGVVYSALTCNVYVPIDYHYQSESDKSTGNLIGVIPVLILVGIMISALGIISFRRM